MQWSCKVEHIGGDGRADGPLTDKITVGDKFFLSCEGPSASLNPRSLTLEVPKPMQYMLRLLDTHSINATGAQFVATTYLVGDFDFKNPVLTDGKERVGLGQFSVHSQTVIKKENNPENKPYGPWSPMALAWPAVIWLFLASVCAVIILLITLALRRSARQRALRTWLENNQSALSPYNQFNRDLRMLSRQIPHARAFEKAESQSYFEELNRSFRFYLTRELQISAIDTRAATILKDLKRVDPNLYKSVRRDLHFTFKEIDSALQVGQTNSVQDAHQLTETCRKLADQIERREKPKAKGK